MSETTDTTDSTDTEATDTISVTFELDEIHAAIVEEMKEGGVDPEQLLKQQCQPTVESTLYQARHQFKHRSE